MPIPLSWLQISHNKIRFFIALAGISFSNLLMFLQFGFRSALFESSIIFHKGIKGDIVLINTQSTNLFALKRFSRRRIYQALSIEGVKSGTSVYIDFGIWQNPVNTNTRQLMVIGIDPNNQVLNLPGFKENKHVTKLEDYILFDRLSRPEFGPIPKLYRQQGRVQTELNQNQVTVKGLFELGASFAADGNVVTNYQTFFNIFSARQPGLIDIGILHTKLGTNRDAIVSQLRERLPNDVIVFSREKFIQYEKQYWQNGTAIGFIFTLVLFYQTGVKP